MYSVQDNYLQKELDTELNSSHKYFGPGADQNGLGTATLAEASLLYVWNENRIVFAFKIGHDGYQKI